MPQAQDEDGVPCYFVADFVLSCEDSSDFAWIVEIEAFAEPRKANEACCGCNEILHNFCGGSGIHRRQKFVQAYKILERFVGPDDFHREGGRSGFAVERLAAHA